MISWHSYITEVDWSLWNVDAVPVACRPVVLPSTSDWDEQLGCCSCSAFCCRRCPQRRPTRFVGGSSWPQFGFRFTYCIFKEPHCHTPWKVIFILITLVAVDRNRSTVCVRACVCVCVCVCVWCMYLDSSYQWPLTKTSLSHVHRSRS